MNGFTIFLLAFVVVGIPVILGVGSEILKTWVKHREAMAATLTGPNSENAARTERLEQRVRVLERIVTDRGLDIADEIERLRASPAAVPAMSDRA